jgi:predicted small lipoprotein YifL
MRLLALGAVMVVLASSLTSGCGQKGSLYLSDNPPPGAKPAKPPAPKPVPYPAQPESK